MFAVVAVPLIAMASEPMLRKMAKRVKRGQVELAE
jgi:hypothetical protein